MTTIASSIETTNVDTASHHRSLDSASSSSTVGLSVVEMSDVSDQLQESDGSNLAPLIDEGEKRSTSFM